MSSNAAESFLICYESFSLSKDYENRKLIVVFIEASYSTPIFKN